MLTLVSGSVLAGAVAPLQAVDPAAVAETSGALRAAVAFPATVLLGGVAVYRYRARIDDAAGASMANPALSAVYGALAFGALVFGAAFALSELSRFGMLGPAVSAALGVGLVVAVVALGSFGFGVVGAGLADALGSRDPMVGLVGAAGASAVAWLLLPFALGALAWVAIAAVGVGGPAREWVHDDAVGGQD